MSAALCLALMAGFAWGLQHYTGGFEIWTFEGRRQARLPAGELRAPAIALIGADETAPALWRDGNPAPAAYLVDFIYTRCPGVCRALGSEYQQMQRHLAGRHSADPALDAVHLVSVSFDVEHDRPERLARYASGLRADPRWWTFAVPATQKDARLLLRSLGVVTIPDGQGGFVHNGSIHLLDAAGRLRGVYEFGQWPQALEAARHLVTIGGEVLP